MRADTFISQLTKVKQTGHGRWLACCPAHDDRTPSLTIAEGDDGRILLHCFGGCSVEDVVGAVGMTLSDIMPERPLDAMALPARHMRFNPMDVLKAMRFQALVVAIAASDIAKGKPLTADERYKLFSVAGEFDEAIQLCN